MEKLREILNNLLDSFKTNANGYSARKISAFVIIVMVVVLHIKWFQSDIGIGFRFRFRCFGNDHIRSNKEKQPTKGIKTTFA